MTQEELSSAIGVDQTSISKLCHDKVKNPRKLADIAKRLGVPEIWLRYGVQNIEALTPEILEMAGALSMLTADDQDQVRALIKRLQPPAE